MINLSDAPAGIYYLQLKLNTEQRTIKLVKQ
ncbi:MAG: T9SS type A sorting domain-containing protein [Bacteroidetes bacterium]|nr:T9SS type A sorting domain-containing protein [Bacteroidota bacterium]